jgi:rSAM/selenodomain-associated transferase 2
LKVLPVIEPQLSIIIPTLNEAESLPLLLQDVAGQQKISLEVLISDGGSEDQTCQAAARFLAGTNIQHQVLSGPPGRGRQMNRAAGCARGHWLLFLHADSRLYDSDVLQKSLTLFEQENAQDEICRVAGHFALKFDLPEEQKSLGLFFSEAKARLNESGCTHGDQGFMLASEFFREVGPFREDLPVMEDAWLAEIIREKGRWLLLPYEIYTSARRFQTEGLTERQTLNALLMNFLFIGWEDFLREAPAIYRQQRNTGFLKLQPFRREITRLLQQLSFKQRCRLWYATGRYVRGQAWQLVYFREARRHFLSGSPVSEVSSGKYQQFRRWFDPLTDNPVGICLTAILVWCWFFLRFGREVDSQAVML